MGTYDNPVLMTSSLSHSLAPMRNRRSRRLIEQLSVAQGGMATSFVSMSLACPLGGSSDRLMKYLSMLWVWSGIISSFNGSGFIEQAQHLLCRVIQGLVRIPGKEDGGAGLLVCPTPDVTPVRVVDPHKAILRRTVFINHVGKQEGAGVAGTSTRQVT